MNLARHRINKEKKELRSSENGLNINWRNELLSKYVHLAALVGKQRDVSSLFFFLNFFPCPILFTLPASQEMDFFHLHKRRSLQIPPDSLKLFIPGQCKIRIHIVSLASWGQLWMHVVVICRTGESRWRLLLLLNDFSCVRLVGSLCDKLQYEHRKSQN